MKAPKACKELTCYACKSSIVASTYTAQAPAAAAASSFPNQIAFRATRPARPPATLLKLRKSPKSPELKKEEARQKRKMKRINDREQEQLLMDEEWFKLNVYGL